jgi:hypothetical protein
MTQYTDQEKQTLRTAAFGAVFLVSKAEPGMFDMVKESFAASKAFATSSPELRDMLKGGGIPQIPKGSAADIESGVLRALEQSASILQAKGQPELDGFRHAVANAVDQAAMAAGGISAAERDAVGKVMAALGAG